LSKVCCRCGRVNMQLTDPREIERVLDTVKGRRPRVTREAAPPRQREPETRSRICKCGQCAWCIDNARWERIFAAKFADPTYYLPRPPRTGSSLDFRP
jgi:hypothetical protein